MQQNLHVHVSLPTSSLFEMQVYFPLETAKYFPDSEMKKTQISLPP